jgi:predicted Zn-dependent protease
MSARPVTTRGGSAAGARGGRAEEGLRFLSRDECAALVQRIRGFAQGGGRTAMGVNSWWSGELRWGRNRVSLASDRRDIDISIFRSLLGLWGNVGLNQMDDVSLTAAVRAAERDARLQPPALTPIEVLPPAFEYPKTAIWSDATYGLTVEERERIARALVEPAEAAGMLSAGYLQVGAAGIARTGLDGTLFYAQRTQAQCSMTVRDPQGTGSGWAGLSSYDWTKIDPQALAKRALEKCLASRNPVTLEPGRYTVILEPQAVHDLVSIIIGSLDRGDPEDRQTGPFLAGFDNALNLSLSKLGLKIVDERITISHDPTDPALGVVPFFVGQGGDIEPVRPVTWIERGVLTTLATERRHAITRLNENQGHPNTGSYRMSGGTTSVEEMIQTTKRGLLVTRFSNIRPLDAGSLLATGLTRDGLWLIENGKISKAVKNLRFTESPLFMLNSLEQLGEPVPVFNPAAPTIVPPLKARDFSFTSLVDAV